MKLPLKGIIPPVVTPLLSDSKLDEQGMINLFDHVLEGGVHGIFLLGTTGEAPNLSYSLRKEFIKKACAYINKRVPVVVGITDTSIHCSLEIAHVAKESGADALVISAPYYLPISQSEFIYYLEELIPQLPLPFMMYNMPSCTKFHMSLHTVQRAKELGAIGIKDSSGNWPYLLSLIEAFKDSPEFSVIAGSEIFLPDTILNGGHGAVAGGANLYPALFVELYDASVKGDLVKIEELKQKLMLIEEKIYNVGAYSSKYVKTIKSALSAMGICSDFVAMPFRQFNESKRNLIKQNIEEFELSGCMVTQPLKT